MGVLSSNPERMMVFDSVHSYALSKHTSHQTRASLLSTKQHASNKQACMIKIINHPSTDVWQVRDGNSLRWRNLRSKKNRKLSTRRAQWCWREQQTQLPQTDNGAGTQRRSEGLLRPCWIMEIWRPFSNCLNQFEKKAIVYGLNIFLKSKFQLIPEWAI